MVAAIFAGRAAQLFFEHLIEILDIVEAAVGGNGRDFLVASGQQAAAVINAQGRDIAGIGHAEMMTEKSADIAGTDIEQLTDALQRKILLEVRIQILANLSDGLGNAPDGVCVERGQHKAQNGFR